MTQPPPQPNGRPPIAELVIADIRARMRKGIETYGVPLQAFNKRDALRDWYEELLDAAKYAKQAMIERDQLHALLSDMLIDLLKATKCRCGDTLVERGFHGSLCFYHLHSRIVRIAEMLPEEKA